MFICVFQDYINCAEIWVEFTCRHFTVSETWSELLSLCVITSLLQTLTLSLQKREVNTVLADIIKHMTPDRAFEDAYPQVSCLVYKLPSLFFFSITSVETVLFLFCLQLQSVIRKILTYFHDFSVLFSMVSSLKSMKNLLNNKPPTADILSTTLFLRSVSCLSWTCSRRTV